jgi:hypothetical protein
VFIFGLEVKGTTYLMALIHPFDAPTGSNWRSRYREAEELRLTRIRARPLTSTVIISVESIVRGALVVKDGPEPVSDDDFFVVDFIDTDMWWRLKKITLATDTNL